MKQLAASDQRGRSAPAINTILKCELSILNGLHQLLADDLERVDSGIGGPVIARRFLNARLAAHRLLGDVRVPNLRLLFQPVQVSALAVAAAVLLWQPLLTLCWPATRHPAA